MVRARILAADPVVTSNVDRLRFESFSACAGVYARLDLLQDGALVLGPPGLADHRVALGLRAVGNVAGAQLAELGHRRA